MSRYIDADAIQIPSTYVDMFENCRNCKLLDEEQVREIIDSAPSIDIVRCGECKFFETKDVKEFTAWGYKNAYVTFDCKRTGEDVAPDDFCSYGERKEP